jgi:hypothetical protein
MDGVRSRIRASVVAASAAGNVGAYACFDIPIVFVFQPCDGWFDDTFLVQMIPVLNVFAYFLLQWTQFGDSAQFKRLSWSIRKQFSC